MQGLDAGKADGRYIYAYDSLLLCIIIKIAKIILSSRNKLWLPPESKM